MTIKYYEVECAVFRIKPGQDMEVFVNQTGEWEQYEGDESRVLRLSNALSFDEVRPYMDVEPKEGE